MSVQLSKEQIAMRARHLLDQEAGDPERLWWLSFCDPEKPEGQRFLGIAIVRAPGFVTATQVAHQSGCDPGGECRGFCIDETGEKYVKPEEIGRLLTRAEAEAIDARAGSSKEGA